MKKTNFMWSWNDIEKADHDATMTRARAAVLLRAWRRCTTQGTRDFSVHCVRAGVRKSYYVSTTKYTPADTGILIIDHVVPL